MDKDNTDNKDNEQSENIKKATNEKNITTKEFKKPNINFDQPKRRFSFSQENSPLAPEKQETKESVVEKPKSGWQRFMDGVSNLVNKVKESKVGQWVSKAVNTVINSKVFKVVTSNIVGRVVAIGIGVTFAVLAAPLAVVGLVAAGVGVGIGVVKDTIQTRTTRKLNNEHRLLIQNRNNIAVQEQIFKIDPKLRVILESELYTPTKSGKRSETERYVEGKEGASGLKSAAKYGVETVVPLVAETVTNALTNPVMLAKTGAMTAISGGLGVTGQNAIDQKRFELKQGIDTERGKPDTPGYNNITELRKAKREQQKQTMALKQLVGDKGYFKMSDQQKLDKFKEAKDQIEQKVKKVQEAKPGFIARTASIFRDVVRAHNPLDKYNPGEIANLQVTQKTPLAKAMENAQKLDMPTNTVNKEKLKTQAVTIGEQINNHQKSTTQRIRRYSVGAKFNGKEVKGGGVNH
ncbi:hypothetical protein [Candidatus Trichorickettsia mobilis]|uniref:hypothetical protein n=1 Tax=Candidatus Trichorickettsia mobilis TaxID=1346319 RepID=UPI00292EAFA2|nr:hypothetical protein [Candidatus Trichorickettsia mobilis]